MFQRYANITHRLLRTVTGFLFACYGAQKLFGSLGCRIETLDPLGFPAALTKLMKPLRAATSAGTCLLGVVLIALIVSASPPRATIKGNPLWSGMKQEKPGGTTFKNVQVLKGLNDEQLNNTMHFVATSLGVSCDHCHVTTEQGNWPMERDDKQAKRTAREMMRMTLAINAQNFHGETVVTCATCHQGHQKPNGIPPLELPTTSASAPASATLPSAEQLFNRYAQALAGDAALSKFNSRVMKGTLTGGRGIPYPLTIEQKAPDKYRMSITLAGGIELAGFDGAEAWNSSGGSTFGMEGLEKARIQRAADFYIATDFGQKYPAAKVIGEEKIRDRDAFIVEVREDGEVTERLYFDRQDGLLLRRVTLSQTALGPFPERTDFADYRPVNGVQFPFNVVRMEINSKWTEKYTTIELNAPLDDAIFAKPKPRSP